MMVKRGAIAIATATATATAIEIVFKSHEPF